jgi:hypothetical protein
MTDSTLNRYIASGTDAERLAFTPSPPTPASGPDPSYIWKTTDGAKTTYMWNFDAAAWEAITSSATVPDPIVPADGTQNITGNLVTSGTLAGSNLSGTNTGDQTSIVGITGTLSEFNTALTGADFATGGGTVTGTSSGTNTGDQTSIVGITGTIAQFNTGGGTATGTNTGDQTITLTGNVTGSGTGSFATTIASGVVTLAMQANMATASVVYRKTAGSGAPEVQTLATLKTDLGLTGTNSGDQTITLTSDVTGSGTGSFATTIAAGVVTLAKMANIATDRLIGRDTAGTGVPEALTVGGGVEFTGAGGIQTSALTGDVTKTAGGTATTIANNAVSFAKFVAAPSVGVVWATGAANYSHNASGGGTANFLRADGTWAVPPGGGGFTPPTGTGFVHITAGAMDAASKLVDTADINDAQVTLAKIANVAANRIIGRAAGTSGVVSEIAISPSSVLGRQTSGNLISMLMGSDFDTSTATINVVAFTGDVTKTLGGTALTIANGVVSGAKLTANGQVRCITFIIDGGGSAITTGIKGDLEIPFACTITGWTLLLDQSGSIVIDIWKDTYANYPPVVGDTITASDKPTVSAAVKGQDLAPTGWTTAITAGDTLRFNVDSASTATRATLSIRVNVT